MRRINLLPTARRGRSAGIGEHVSFLKNLPPRTWTVGMGVLALLIALILVVSVTSRRRAVDGRIVEVEAELSDLRVIVEEVNGLRSLKETLDEKMSVVDRLIIGRLCWARYLNRIAFLMNEDSEIARRVWLKSMEMVQIRSMEERPVEKKNRRGQIVTETQRISVVKPAIQLQGVVTGETGATHLVGTVMELLGDDPIIKDYIDNVELDSIGEVRGRGPEGKEFKLILILRKQGTRGV